MTDRKWDLERVSRVAFKEWAVVCTALASGRQTIILRKGGIHEGREGFRVEHDQFWLLPTAFHQSLSSLSPDAEPLLAQTLALKPPQGQFLVAQYARVEEVFQVAQLEKLRQLASHHIWSDATVEQRFNYRQPGLFVLTVRIYHVPEPVTIADSPYIGGCRSWVELPEALSTDELRPVLDDAAFQRQAAEVRRLLG